MDNWLRRIAIEWALAHWKQIAAWVLARAQEPSTYAGLISLAITNLHLEFSSDLRGALVRLGLNLGGVLAVVLREKAGVAPEEKVKS